MNKLLRLSCAGSLLLAGCSKNSKPAPVPAPDPAQLVTTWTFQSERYTTTPKSGAAATTDLRPIATGSYTITFNTDGSFLTTTNGANTATGTYAYSNNTITVPYPGGPNGPKAQVLTVKELTASRLIATEATEDTSNRYLTTDTYSR
jgi:hypothetical protein